MRIFLTPFSFSFSSPSPLSLSNKMGSIGPETGHVGDEIAGDVPRKPRFLCLHGFRTSAAIMKKQVVGKWPSHVTSRLDLFFADAPFPAEGKSDVEGIFPPPYYEWFQFSKVRLPLLQFVLYFCFEIVIITWFFWVNYHRVLWNTGISTSALLILKISWSNMGLLMALWDSLRFGLQFLLLIIQINL